MTGEPSERTGAPPRSLRRRTSDRVLGGVAGGLGDYFNIDPLLIRIAFVALMIFGGAGIVLYVVAWLLIPAEGQEASNVESFLGRLGLTPRRIAWIAFALIVIVLITNMPIGGPLDGSGTVYIGPLPGMNPAGLWALLIIVTGIVLLRRRDAAPTKAAVPSATEQATVAIAQPVVPPRPRSPLTLYACAAVLLSIGLLAIVSQTMELSARPGQFFGAALTVMGIGLIVGAWWGRARILILIAMLLLPVAVGASFITTPLEGGVGDHRYVPVTVAELKDEYRSLSGRTILDLQDLQTSPRDIYIAASVAIGQQVVILPEGASIELRTRVGAGDSYVLGSSDGGTSLDNHYVRRIFKQTTYVLDIEVGIGQVVVTDARVNW
jgi:phage shock protein PspC (stress-responsive transcriptional regulator)